MMRKPCNYAIFYYIIRLETETHDVRKERLRSIKIPFLGKILEETHPFRSVGPLKIWQGHLFSSVREDSSRTFVLLFLTQSPFLVTTNGSVSMTYGDFETNQKLSYQMNKWNNMHNNQLFLIYFVWKGGSPGLPHGCKWIRMWYRTQSYSTHL